MKILVTGVAGFIGFHLTNSLLNLGHDIFGVDNLNDYYDPSIKTKRLELINSHFNRENFKFSEIDISNRDSINDLFLNEDFSVVIHLAAQAGVRYSIENPNAYVDSNLLGFMNILEGCRSSNVGHFIYASSSSVYGLNKSIPFNIKDRVDHPISLYAATKKSNELLAHSYSHLYSLPTTGLRFFTVYGPYGRPDMAYYKFTKAIINNEEIEVYNHGDLERDFTYINDIVAGIIKAIKFNSSSKENSLSNTNAPYRIFNLGNNKPIKLKKFIEAIEKACNKKARISYLPMQPGDVKVTYADIEDSINEIGFKPSIDIDEGMKLFVNWYIKYHGYQK